MTKERVLYFITQQKATITKIVELESITRIYTEEAVFQVKEHSNSVTILWGAQLKHISQVPIERLGK